MRNFVTEAAAPNSISLSWTLPLDFNDTIDEIIVTRTSTHFPVELFNATFPTKATDSRPIEIFRAKTIVGTDTGTISVSGSTLTDTSATFSTSPPLNGRLLRDTNSEVFRIVSNTSTTVTVIGEPANGKYIILPDFPTDIRVQENYEQDDRTSAGPGFVQDLVVAEAGSLLVKEFIPGELTNLIFVDSNGDRFLIKNNNSNTVFFFEDSSTPVLGVNTAILNSFAGDTQPLPYIDTFLTEDEADARVGTGLLDNLFYYYTTFTKPEATNVAQAEFGQIDSGTPTQAAAISARDRQFGRILFSLWPTLYQELDATGDLEDLMQVFGFQFNELHALISTYNLQDPQTVFVNALLPLSEQTGLPAVGFSIGIDTLRRIAKDLIGCWRLKGSKEGIALFIRKITTWDITDGTADYSGSIQDFLPNVEALRFFDPNLGSLNTRITNTDPFIAGGRFARSLPGIVIPGFFTFREFVINIPEVALFVGNSEAFTVAADSTIMEDSTQNFGSDDSLVGNFLIPNQEEINDIFEIIANTNTTITVQGIITNRVPDGNYAILSPLNTNRFIILNKLLPVFIPLGTKAGFQFV